MAQRAGRDVQAFVIYAEIPHTLFITVPMDWTVGSLKKRVNNEMKSHMNGLLPGIQLDSETCDIFPGKACPYDKASYYILILFHKLVIC